MKGLVRERDCLQQDRTKPTFGPRWVCATATTPAHTGRRITLTSKSCRWPCCSGDTTCPRWRPSWGWSTLSQSWVPRWEVTEQCWSGLELWWTGFLQGRMTVWPRHSWSGQKLLTNHNHNDHNHNDHHHHCRMFAGDNAAVADTDIVLTVDANLFVMSPEIIRPLLSSPDMVAWVLNWNYENYTNNWTFLQNTFGIGLMAMRAASWKEVTGYQGSIEGLVKQYR